MKISDISNEIFDFFHFKKYINLLKPPITVGKIIIILILLLSIALSIYGSKEFFISKYFDIIPDKEEISQYENSIKANTEESYNYYLENFPHGKHKKEILERLTQLRRQDRLDWIEAKELNSEESYKRYLEKHPSGTYIVAMENELNRKKREKEELKIKLEKEEEAKRENEREIIKIELNGMEQQKIFAQAKEHNLKEKIYDFNLEKNNLILEKNRNIKELDLYISNHEKEIICGKAMNIITTIIADSLSNKTNNDYSKEDKQAAAGFSLLCAFSGDSDLPRKIEAAKEYIEQSNSYIKKLQEQINALSHQVDETEQLLVDEQSNLTQLLKKIDTYKAKLLSLNP